MHRRAEMHLLYEIHVQVDEYLQESNRTRSPKLLPMHASFYGFSLSLYIHSASIPRGYLIRASSFTANVGNIHDDSKRFIDGHLPGRARSWASLCKVYPPSEPNRQDPGQWSGRACLPSSAGRLWGPVRREELSPGAPDFGPLSKAGWTLYPVPHRDHPST